MLNIFTPQEKAKQIINDDYGEITYARPGEKESLGGIVCTRNDVFRVFSIGQTYEFGSYGRPVLTSQNLKVEKLTKSKPISQEEKINRRKKYIESARISGPEISDYSASLGEWGDNPRTEPRTRKIREIYVLCKGCEIPIWICDTLEPVINWGESKKAGIDSYLREKYQQYLGLPLYKIPPINFAEIDISYFPEPERKIIAKPEFKECKSLAEQTIFFLKKALKEFNLNPILIDQKKLRDTGAYKKGINIILSRREEFESIFGKDNLFRVECPKCGKYIYNTSIEQGKVKGKCERKVKTQRGAEFEQKYQGCGSVLEENVDYLYKCAVPNGKIVTAIYMSNSDAGVFYPDAEFVPENVAAGELEKIILTTGQFFDSGAPKIVATGWFTKDGIVDNVFEVLDLIPPEDIKERFEATPPNRRIDLKQNSIESTLIAKIKKINPPTDPRLLADIMYSLSGSEIDIEKLNWNFYEPVEYIQRLLKYLGKLRKNKLIIKKPEEQWKEDYQSFMKKTYIKEEDVEKFKKNLANPNTPTKTVIEITYLAGLIN